MSGAQRLRALRIYAGPVARAHLRQQGLAPEDVAVIPAAAGGPKGLMLGPLDRFLFGEWLARSTQPVDLVGASIGAWRMAAACLPDALQASQWLEHDYIHEDYTPAPGQRRPSPQQVSAQFAANLQRFFGGREGRVLAHPRYRLHVVTARGQGVLAKPGAVRTALGYSGAYLSNAVHRTALGAWLERAVFSAPDPVGRGPAPLPFATQDLRTRPLVLTPENFQLALRASCSIPFVLEGVCDIPQAPPGVYWDGGITDYHLHLHYRPRTQQGAGLVLYPHFQRAVVPGWLDKALRWRHRATPALERMIVLAPDPAWVAALPGGKLPDRHDFATYLHDGAERMRIWSAAVAAAQQLADEWAEWLERPDPACVEAL